MANLEESVRIVGQAIRLAFESSCSLKVPKGNRGAPWWSRELQEQRARVRLAFKKANFSRDQQDWVAQADLQRQYNYSVRAAQKKVWEDYCEGIKSYLKAARLNSILAGKPGGWLE